MHTHIIREAGFEICIDNWMAPQLFSVENMLSVASKKNLKMLILWITEQVFHFKPLAILFLLLRHPTSKKYYFCTKSSVNQNSCEMLFHVFLHFPFDAHLLTLWNLLMLSYSNWPFNWLNFFNFFVKTFSMFTMFPCEQKIGLWLVN